LRPLDKRCLDDPVRLTATAWQRTPRSTAMISSFDP